MPLEAALRDALSHVSGRIYLAVSGGEDSRALLHAAARVLDKSRLLTVHADHGWSDQSQVWARAVCRNSLREGVPCRVRKLRLARADEAEARDARYAWFASMLRDGDALVTAHHERDQAETVMIRVSQGRGAYGMPPQRALGAGRLIRPWLEVPKAAVLSYLHEARLEGHHDPSNAAERFDRAFVRHHLADAARARWSDWDARVARVGRTALAGEAAARHWLRDRPCLPLNEMEADVAIESVRLWVSARYGATCTRSALAGWLGRSGDSVAKLDLTGGRLVRDGTVVWFVPELELPRVVPLTVGQSVLLPHGELVVRGVRTEEASIEFGCAARRFQGQRVSELLRRHEVFAWMRDRVPLVCAAGQVVAVAGVAAVPGMEVCWRPDPLLAGTFSARELLSASLT